jgi:hypothetical protein
VYEPYTAQYSHGFGRRLTVRTKLPPTAAVDYTPLNPVNFLLRSAQIYPHKTAIIYGQKRYSYADFALRVKNLATALVNHYNIKPGERVGSVIGL